VEALAFAAIVAGEHEVQSALEGGPLMVVAPAPRGDFHSFACDMLARSSRRMPLTLLLLEVEGDANFPESLPRVTVGPDALAFGSGASLALRGELPEAGPLAAEEIRLLTPATLRARLLGAESEEEAESARAPPSAAAERANRSAAALKEAAGDLEELARKRAKVAAKRAERKAEYEAGDFDLS